jgi:hypothetical protein
MCHRALKPCNDNVSSRLMKIEYGSIKSPILEGPYPWSLLDYPNTEDEILSTWESRTSLWESLKDHFLIRKFSCYTGRPVLYSKDDEGAFRF